MVVDRTRKNRQETIAFVNSTFGVERATTRMNVSLIICTRDRSRQLSACLESVRRLTFEQPWELILLDNGSVDDTANVIKEFIETASVPVTYLPEPNRG